MRTVYEFEFVFRVGVLLLRFYWYEGNYTLHSNIFGLRCLYIGGYMWSHSALAGHTCLRIILPT